MRGATIQKILSNLPQKEFDEFLTLLESKQLNPNLNSFCKKLRFDHYTEEVAIGILKVSKRKKNSLLDEIGSSLELFFGGKSHILRMESRFEVVKNLSHSFEYEAAFQLLRPLLNSSIKLERFDLAVRCLRLIKRLRRGSYIDSLTIEDAASHLALNSQLLGLLEKVDRIRSINSVSLRKASLIEIRSSSLRIFEERKLGQRGQLTFLKIQFKIDLLLQDSPMWPMSQEAVVAQIEAHPWICEDWEFEYAREQRTLSQAYWQAKLYPEFRLSCAKFWTSSFTARQAQFEQAIHQFPFLFGVAIDSGDEKLGERALVKFTQCFDDGIFSKSPELLTQNYYYITYFLIATNQTLKAKSYLAKLLRFQNQDFIPTHIFMVNILSVVVMLESREIADAQRILKNLKNTKGVTLVGGGVEAIEFLKAFSNTIDFIGNFGEWTLNRATLKLLATLKEKDVLKYFNLEVWFYSLNENRPMLEIFKDRAISKDAFHLRDYQK